MTTYYVSSEIGSNNNAGTSTTAPLATLQAAADRVQPGDTVEVMNGTYTGPQGGDVVDITTSGTASAPITFEAAPGQTPVINSSGSWNAIKIEASYIVVNGFTVVGDAANYTLPQALAGYSTGSPKLDGAGINVTGTPGVNVPNHITIENNTVYNEPGAGIGSGHADYLNILNNVVHDNAHWSAFGNSGISIVESGNSDTNSGVHDIISGNLVFGNAQLVPTNGAGTITDGEGIILDTNTGFVGEILVENNTVYGNGSAGIESFRTNGAVITENTVYGNNTANVLPASLAEIFLNQSNNDTVTNNITTAPDLTPPTISSLTESPSSGDLNAGKTVTYTITMSEAVTVSGGTPTLTLNDGGVASYTGGSGSKALTFSYTVAAGQNAASLAATAVNLNSATITDAAGNAANLSLSGLTQSGPQIDSTTPTIASLTETPSTGHLNASDTVTFTLNLNEVVTVAGGTPTLTLNDGGVATYTGGSGSKALTFSYTVAAGQNAASLAATAVNLNSATITDGAGNAANLSLLGLTQSGPQIDSTTPTIASLTETPSTGHLNASDTVTFTLNLNEVVTVAGGTPTLTLNDGGVATYTGGSGSKALTFSYTVAAGQNAASLAATAVNLNSATITDAAGNAANLSLSGLTQSGPQIDTTTPTIASLTETPSTGHLSDTVTFTLNLNEVVTVAGGTPTLTLNDGGVATYTGGSGSNALTFSYTVAAGQNAASLAATAVNLNSATVTDGAGNAANLSLTGLTQSGPQIDTTTPTVSSVVSSGNGITSGSGALNAGKTVTLTLKLSAAVTVAGGKPTLALNDGGTASYIGGSGSNALTFSYTVAAGQNTSDLTVTALKLNSATVTDAAGNTADLSGAVTNPAGTLQIDTTTRVIQTDGSTSLTQVADRYHLYGSSGSGPALKYKGASVTAGEFGAWTPIGAIQTASGYDVAWKNTGTGQYTVWSTDSNGNYKGFLTGGAVSGMSYALESIEPVFQQNLNGDGVIGPTTTVIQTDGSTSLTQVADRYHLYGSSGSGPALKYKGASVTAGEFGAWTPIGAIQTASGYDVAWKNTGTGQYTVWSTDSNGNYKGFLTGGAVSGMSYALESIEPVFQQNLNGDGVIGPTTTVIQTDGSTSLTQVADRYHLYGSSGSGPALKYKGASVTAGEFGAWTPIGAIQTASGYDVAWKNTGTGQYTVWSTDSNGNYKGFLTGGAVSGMSYALESIEPVFQQNLNGDGVIGPTTTVIQTDGSTSLTQVVDRYYLYGSSGSGPALKYNRASVTAGEFGKWTPIGAVQTASGFDVAWKNTGTGQYTVWTTNSNGNYAGNLIGAVSGKTHALESLEPVFNQDLNGDGNIGLYAASGTTLKITQSLSGASGSATIGGNATLEVAAADSAPVIFATPTGTLKLDQPSTFAGTVAGFGWQDHIDLPSIALGAPTTLGYTENSSNTGGTLTISDGAHAASIALLGNYVAASFVTTADGHGGTLLSEAAQVDQQPQLAKPHP